MIVFVMKLRLFQVLLVLMLCGSFWEVNASWLSDVTGININIPKSTVASAAQILGGPVNELPGVVGKPPTEPIASATDKVVLIGKLQAFQIGTAHASRIYSNVSVGVVLGSILFGICASIAAFCKASRIAGVLSILATGILGIGNAFPINQNADFYRLLSARSEALLEDAELRPNMTLGEYDNFRNGLGTLIRFEGEKFPSRTATQSASEDLLKQLDALSAHLGSVGPSGGSATIRQ